MWGDAMEITVPNVNIALLKQQRNHLLSLTRLSINVSGENDELEGVISLLDAMLDIAEVGRIM